MFTRFLSFSLLLLTFSCFGQAFTPMRPFVPTTGEALTPEQIASTGLAYRWIETNYDGTWVDIIQGSTWQNGNAAQVPVYTEGVGILTDPTHWLTNAWTTWVGDITSNIIVGFIFEVTRTGETGNANPGILANRVTALRGYVFNSSPVFNICNYYGASAIIAIPGRFPYTNSVTDQIWEQGKDGETFHVTLYTNSVIATNLATSTWIGKPTYVPYVLGRNIFVNTAPTINWREIWIWTNPVAGPYTISDEVLTNFHKYATNKYGYSP